MCWSSTTPTCSNVRFIQHDPNTGNPQLGSPPHRSGAQRHIAMSLAVHTSNQIVERARISRAAARSIVSTLPLPSEDGAPRRPASATTRALLDSHCGA